MVDEHKAHKAILAYEKGWLAFSLAMLFVFIALIAYTLATHTAGVIPDRPQPVHGLRPGLRLRLPAEPH